MKIRMTAALSILFSLCLVMITASTNTKAGDSNAIYLRDLKILTEDDDRFVGNIAIEAVGDINECPETYCEPPCRTDTEIAQGKDKYYDKRSQRNTAIAERNNAEATGNTQIAEQKGRESDAFQMQMDKEAFMTVLHLVNDSIGYNEDSLLLWIDNLDLFSMDMFFTMQHQSNGNTAIAQERLNHAAKRNDLTQRERKTLREMPDFLQIIKGKQPEELSISDLRMLEKFAEDDYGFVGNISRNLLRLHGYHFTPVINIDESAKERSELLNNDVRSKTVSVRPNPVRERLTIQLLSETETTPNSIFEIFDLNGKSLRRIKPTNTIFSLSVQQFQKGVYFYQYTSSVGEREQGKFIVH